jgi:hypothetical protein
MQEDPLLTTCKLRAQPCAPPAAHLTEVSLVESHWRAAGRQAPPLLVQSRLQPGNTKTGGCRQDALRPAGVVNWDVGIVRWASAEASGPEVELGWCRRAEPAVTTRVWQLMTCGAADRLGWGWGRGGNVSHPASSGAPPLRRRVKKRCQRARLGGALRSHRKCVCAMSVLAVVHATQRGCKLM